MPISALRRERPCPDDKQNRPRSTTRGRLRPAELHDPDEHRYVVEHCEGGRVNRRRPTTPALGSVAGQPTRQRMSLCRSPAARKMSQPPPKRLNPPSNPNPSPKKRGNPPKKNGLANRPKRW